MKNEKEHIMIMKRLTRNFDLLAFYIDENELHDLLSDDFKILINNYFYQSQMVDYQDEDEFFESFDDYVDFTIDLIESELDRLHENIKTITLSEFLQTRSYLYDFAYDDDGILLIGHEESVYNMLYCHVLDQEGIEIEKDIYEIVDMDISKLVFSESSYEIAYPNEKQLDDFIQNKMF